jgi:hypothetical protein
VDRLSFGRSRHAWEDGIKMELKEIGMQVSTEFIWLRMGTVVLSFEHSNEP